MRAYGTSVCDVQGHFVVAYLHWQCQLDSLPRIMMTQCVHVLNIKLLKMAIYQCCIHHRTTQAQVRDGLMSLLIANDNYNQDHS